MKIAYVTNMRFPSERAHATQVVHMANAFASLGHDVTLFTTTRKTHITESPETYYGVRFSFAQKRIRILDIVGHIHSFPKFLHTYLYLLERLLFAISFVFSTRGETYDVLYCRDEWVLWFVSLFRQKQKVVWESHEAKYNHAARKLIAHGNIVVISEGIRNRYVALGHSTDQFIVAHDAVDDTFFTPQVSKEDARQRLDLTSEKPVVMYIGGFDTWKGVATLFEVSLILDEVKLVVIGGTLKEVEAAREKYSRIQFLGSRPYKELPVYQRAADILVIPNTAKNELSANYTSPLKLFAHMTSNVPIVLSDIPSLRAVLDDGSAFFFIPDDVTSLRRVILDAISDPIEGVKKATSAYEKSLQYTWKQRAASILEGLATK